MIFRAFPVFALLLFQAADSSQSVEDQLWHLRNLGKAFYRLDDDLDIFTLLMGCGEERKITELRQHSAQLRLENNEDTQ